MINSVRINNLRLSLITETKTINNTNVLEGHVENNNVISLKTCTNKIEIEVYKEKDINVDVDIRTRDIFIYENNELTAIATPLITSEQGDIIKFNASYENDVITFNLEENMEVDAQISFAIMSDTKIFHIGNIKETEYWYDAPNKNIFRLSSNEERVIVAKHDDFSSVPYLAPKMISGEKVFYDRAIYSINSDKTLMYESLTEYSFLTALPNNYFIGLKFSNEGCTITYDIVSYSNSTGFTINDSYTVDHLGDVNGYAMIPVVTSVDESGRTLNLCLINSFMYDLNTEAYYSASIDIQNPRFNFGKSSKGIAILKESGPGPRIYYNVNQNKLYIGSLNTKITAIHPVYAQTDYFTALATSTVSVQGNKYLISYNINEERMPNKYLHNSINGTAYTVTISNKEATAYEFIDFSISKIVEPINRDNVYLLDNSVWDYIEHFQEDYLYVMPRVIFKGPKGLYSKRLLFFSYDVAESSNMNPGLLSTRSDGKQHYRNFKTTDDILFDVTEIYSTILTPKDNAFILEKVDALPVTTFIDTKRTVKKNVTKKISIDTERKVINYLRAFRIRVRRKVAAPISTSINRIYRKVSINTSSIIDTIRSMCFKSNKEIKTERRVVLNQKNANVYLDTKLTILNTIKSRGPLTRRTSINHSTTIPNITRPVVWIYKLNDGYPIDLDTSRTLHKSTTSKIETLRRVEHDFYYTTTFSIHRSTSITATASILSDRQVVKDSSSIFDSKRQLAKKHKLFSKTSRKLSAYANDSISTTRRTSNTSSLNTKSNRQVIDYGHSKLKTIRRVSKDNCICCNALTNRRVVTDTQTAFNSNRKVITSNIDSFTLDTNRLIAVNYMSGYAFTKRHISSNTASDIDSYRFTTHKVSPELDVLRKSAVFDWFWNPTVRTVTNEADISYLTNRKTTRDTFVAQDTSRSSYHKIKPVLETKREIIKSIEEEIDSKRRVAAEISNEVDVTKKIAAKYIYLNKGQRLIVKSTDKDIDAYRETRKAFVNIVDTSRTVESDNIKDTLCVDFELKHGCLYETERCFYEANQ